jgi:HEAT repeat protein
VTIAHKKWLLAGVLLLAAAAGALFCWRPAEPEYAGKPLSYWLRECCRSGQRMTSDAIRHEEAAAALREMGPSAVPRLLEYAFDIGPASGGRKDVCRLLNALPRSWGLPAPVEPEIMSDEAADALKEIKPPAHQLLPFLEPRLKSTKALDRRQALYILGCTGQGAEEVVPLLCAALKCPDAYERGLAIQSLGWLGPRAGAAVPALIEVLRWHDTTNQPPVRLERSAAGALGKIGSAAAPALSLVQALFEKETDWRGRCLLATALCRLDGGQTNALAFLTNSLTTHQPVSDRWVAAWHLGDIGPSAKAAVPSLLAALDVTNDTLFSQVPGALKKLGVPAEAFLPRMRKQLRSQNETTRVNAAARVSEMAPADHEALLVLMDHVSRRTAFQDFAIEALARAGPPAAEAIPVLRQVAEHGAKPEREAARRALRRIEAKFVPGEKD